MKDYFSATRHPWATFLFLVPLLAAYEIGVAHYGGQHTDVRNGADAWLRWGLDRYGITQLWVVPAAVAVYFLIRAVLAWESRPKDTLATLFGMAVECVVYGVLLWAVSRNFKPILDQLGVSLTVSPVRFEAPPASKLVTFVGAGIYEEVIFRLGLFTLLSVLFRTMLLPKPLAIVVAAVVGSLLFAAAHHVGENGDPFQPTVFAFRTLAGLYFNMLYVTRGFGIAVGAHAGYDVLVGVAVG
ncbi:MAG TPA: CPBP family intramembrane glutamic endopeptidase [Fimbriiglobus sp.]